MLCCCTTGQLYPQPAMPDGKHAEYTRYQEHHHTELQPLFISHTSAHLEPKILSQIICLRLAYVIEKSKSYHRRQLIKPHNNNNMWSISSVHGIYNSVMMKNASQNQLLVNHSVCHSCTN